MKISALILPILLTACGTPAIVTQRVEIPIPVRPIAAADVPIEPVSEFARTAPAAPLDAQVQALLIDRETVKSYAVKLRALVGACVAPAAPQRLPTIE